MRPCSRNSGGGFRNCSAEQAVPRENEPKGEGEGEKGEKESDFDFLQEDSGAEDEGEEEKKQIWSYSPQEKLMVKDFREFSFEETSTLMREFQRLIAQWVMRMSRRKTPSSKGREMDFRRTIRRTVRHGGEILELVRRRPKQKPLKIIVLCDVSGSMDPALTFVLQFFFSMQRAFRNSETFVFSTRLTRITDILNAIAGRRPSRPSVSASRTGPEGPVSERVWIFSMTGI